MRRTLFWLTMKQEETLLSAGSWAGWVAWGGEKGRGGGGEREGSPSAV